MATEREDRVNANRAYQNAWLVYINGLEVPVASVSVSYGVWQIPQAEIVMIPDPSIQRLGSEDRVAVQIFFCDHWIKPQKPEFRLLFDGEIIGWSYVNVQRGRSLSFTAVDYIQIFTQLFFFFMSSIDDLAVGALGQTTGVSLTTVNTPGFAPLFPYSLFSKGLVQAKAEGSQNIESPLITRPIEYVRNVVTGLTADLDRRSVPAANFFSPWAKRTKFDKRFVALPYLEDGKAGSKGVFPILRAVQADWAISAVAGLTSNIGTAGSIWQVFEQVLSTLMMELAMIPTPPSVTVDRELNILGAPPKAYAPEIVNNLAAYFVKPQFLFGLPPTCNVFYPSQITQFGYQENYATQPTRMYFNDESWTSYLSVNQSNNSSGLDAVVRAALTVAHPEEVNIAMRAALQDPKLNAKNVLVYPEEFFRGPVVDRRSMPRWFLFLNNARNQPGVDINDKTLTEEQRIEVARSVMPGDTQHNIFRLYAAYEYQKERYARRTAGVSMAFNPYPMPGFPCAVFDRRSTKVDIFAYVMNVRHVLSSRMMQTDVSMSYGRTMQEAFALLRKSIEMENADIITKRADVARSINENNGTSSTNTDPQMERVGPIAVGPAEPLIEVRDTIQNFDRAEAFYRSLLYRSKPKNVDEISQAQQRADIIRRADEVEGRIIPALAQDAKNTSDVDAYLGSKDASFQYHKIIYLTSEKGKSEAVKLQGIDTTTRLKMISVIEKMRSGSATAEDLTFIRGATAQPELQQLPADGNADPNIIQRLNLLDEEIQNSTTSTNLNGNVDIDPAPTAGPLFESFEAAMFYNARPICTLDEYLVFLGEEAVEKKDRGIVLPGVALAADDERTFPAVYYRRIRKYRAGPPQAIPDTGLNLTNATGVTTPDGVWIVLPTPTEFNLAQRQENIAALVNDPAKVTNKVQGVPDDFPQTSQDWDAVLQVYRSNVLSRLAPGK